MKKKCPWCGSAMTIHFGVFGEYKCDKCNKNSVIKRDGWSYWLPALALVGITIAFGLIYTMSSLIIIYAIGLLSSNYAPLIRSDYKYVPVKAAEASFKLKEKHSLLFKKLTFLEDSIFYICFKDENDKPISHMLAVSIDDIHFQNESIDCNFSFMPECKYNTDYHANTIFNIYDNGKLIGEGHICDDVKNKQFPVADNKL